MSMKDYEKAVNQKRKPTADVLRDTVTVCSVAKYLVEYVHVRALCYGVGIKFTGDSARKSAKPARKRKAK